MNSAFVVESNASFHQFNLEHRNLNRDLYSSRGELEGSKYSVDFNAFHCVAPLSFFEKTRKKCPHEGHCREEGLLLALLTGKKKLDYNHKVIIEPSQVYSLTKNPFFGSFS